MMSPHSSGRSKGIVSRWRRRFGDAFDGLRIASIDQESLWVHFVAAAIVIGLATFFELELWRWCVIILCVTLVISLELVNSAIERLVKTLHPEHDAGLAEALHMAAAAVLVAAIGTAVIGFLLLLPPIIHLL
jgi:diacylglycerol kinase